jgi:hypothetical protein
VWLERAKLHSIGTGCDQHALNTILLVFHRLFPLASQLYRKGHLTRAATCISNLQKNQTAETYFHVTLHQIVCISFQCHLTKPNNQTVKPYLHVTPTPNNTNKYSTSINKLNPLPTPK